MWGRVEESAHSHSSHATTSDAQHELCHWELVRNERVGKGKRWPQITAWAGHKISMTTMRRGNYFLEIQSRTNFKHNTVVRVVSCSCDMYLFYMLLLTARLEAIRWAEHNRRDIYFIFDLILFYIHIATSFTHIILHLLHKALSAYLVVILCLPLCLYCTRH